MLKLSLLMKRIILIFLISIILSSCSVFENFRLNNNDDIPSGTVLFNDSFDNVESGWRTWINDGSFVIYQAEGLRFYLDQPNVDFWSSPGLKFDDTRVEIEAIKIDGPDNNLLGLICRMQDEKNFYAFVISSDGYGGIYKVLEGEYVLLNGHTLEFSPSIYKGNAINYLSATCDGNELRLDTNGEHLFTVNDDQFTSGDIGLIVGSFEDPGVNIYFDNITVFQP
ncbi:MAG TPA: hypothetical protein VK856_13525 [Anaerolineaceae bacterium]|nr:hypothetical protein [Anaerolineaceae bacterium]